ncbi:MAG TPA: amino acid adenylation domain-containing protein, partial [Longimicrobium sp.]|nr:amino acid adenylation domain-containing protein [Longimicrobium sp.]
PRTPAEELLAGIWAEVLRRGRVGVRESFFDLGGHSLLATRVVSRIREVFGVELPLRAMFEAPTVAGVASAVEEIRRAGVPAAPPVVPVERSGPLALSFAQERLWFLDRLEPGSPLYNVPAALRLAGELDVGALERALGEIVRRHEVLRTVFAEVDGVPVQVVKPFAGFALAVEDLSHLPDGERRAAAELRAAREAALPFDLAAGPLLRPALLRLSGDEHVLLLCMHHIVSDEWSTEVLLGELAALYAAFLAGGEPGLPDLPVQYADYAAWQREHLRGEVLEGRLDWWKARLAGAPALLELPTDHPRPAVQSFRGATIQGALPAGVRAGLEALGRGEGATLYMVVLAAFQVLLSRYSGSADVVVGSPVAGQTRREVEGLIGFFANTLVLRTDLSGDPDFREVLRRVREATLGAFEHQDVPFERLVAELQPERSMGHSPLFQVAFVLADAGRSATELPGLRLERVYADSGTSKFDLTLSIAPQADGIHTWMTYRTDLFDRSTVERMLEHLGRVLEQVAEDADARVSRLELAGADERRTVVEAWNRTARPYPTDVCLHELFESHVRATPGAEALVWGGVRLTYAELDARANRLARHLARAGVGPDHRVGVLLERGVELIVAILAVLKAGGCYVPLDPAYPAERLALMLADAGVRVLLTRSAHAAALRAPGVAVMRLDQAADALARESAEPVRSGAAAENLAYIVYTSGSTGRPKGVMVNHRTVVQLVVETDYVRFGPGDRIAQASNASFDALAFETWGALLNGATLVGIDRDVLLAPSALRETLRAEGITTLYQTTALLNQLSREEPGIFAPLREVLFGGQQVDADAVRRILAAGGPGRLLHMYGPTETTAWCSCEPVEEVAEDALTVSVGRPTGNQRIYLLDAALQPAPLGIPGEAYVGGGGVVRGYLDRPGLTAERFLPDPFAAEPGARMYRTGDRMRWKENAPVRECVSAVAGDSREGAHEQRNQPPFTHALTHSRTHALEFIGRVDEQVKIRGFRIEPGEVESVLSAHPAVREARVVVRQDGPGEKRLVAYVVGEADADALRAHLRRSLPEYMVPAAFVGMPSLPLTPNGKLDTKALPAPELGSAEDRYQPPRTQTEEVLAGIWGDVLGVARVGVADSFFELGGHSLLATRVVSRIRSAFAIELPLRALFEGPTVAALARAVEEVRRAGVPLLPPVVPAGRDRPLPLSFAQERLWFLDRMEPGSTTYNTDWPFRLSGALDVPALERALGEIVRRHEVLRTTFREAGGSPVQVIAPFAGFTLPVHDISLSAAEGEAEVRRRADAEGSRPFDLAAGPLFRPTLLRLADDEHALLLGMHHVVSDGWSLGVLHRELSALYAAYRAGRESPLVPLPVQYADYAVWQREQLAGDLLERQLAYWKTRLAGAPALLELPTDHPRPAVQGYRGALEPVSFSPALLGRLQALGRAEGATLFMVVLAAFQVLLSRYSGSADVVAGTPIAGRTRAETEELIGFFVNTLAVRTDLSGDPSFREVLRRVREATLGAYEHQEVPFERLVAELQPERSLARSPLFQVTFALGDEVPRGGLSGLRWAEVEAEPAAAKFDLVLTLASHERGLDGTLGYRTDLFERPTVARMIGHLGRVLEQVAEDADARVSRLELAGADERRTVIETWNRTARPYPADVCLHERFESHAHATPGAEALVWGGVRLTYAELDARANRLARHLARAGVGPDHRVGVLLERGVELIVSILAVLKAGGCYVPLDPGYPAERLELMLADAGVRVQLTRSAHAAALRAPGVAVVRLDQAADALARECAGPVRSGAAAENLAYIVYTSGSTGRPKGVMVNHRTVVQLVVETDYVRFGPGDRIAQASNASFDALAFETWGALLNGATLVGIDRDVLLSPPALRETLRVEGITTLYQTTALLNQLSREEPGILATLREVLFGGQQVDADAVRRILAAGGPGRLLHMYGPTETTAWCSCEAVEEVAEDALTVSVGRPTGNQRIYLLDAALQPAPLGIPGEAYVGGGGVVRGYLDRPGLTAERFLPDPFAMEPGARMYRTGDRMRWKESAPVRECVSAVAGDSREGAHEQRNQPPFTHALTHSRTHALEFIGRVDEQVKIRGFRIEPGEVESVLSAHPMVEEARVVVRQDGPGEKRLVAYVVGEADADALRAHLRRSLPEYMVPAAFVGMPSLPLTPNGKLDVKALPAPEQSGEEGYVAPQTEVEEALAEIWADVLGVERVGATDDFFALGGHSLLIMRLITRVRDALGVETSIRTVFAAPTLRAMAADVERLIYEDYFRLPGTHAGDLLELHSTAGA